MNWKVLKTEEQYQEAIIRTMAIFHADENSPEEDELAQLVLLVRNYEDKHVHMPTSDLIR